MSGAVDRYLVASLEFEGVLRACLYRYARNAADVDELLQETYAHLLAAFPDAPVGLLGGGAHDSTPLLVASR